MNITDLYDSYSPVFRGNYYCKYGRFCFKDHTYFAYCFNNKQWLVFKDGYEVGIVNSMGKQVMNTFFNAHIA